MRRIMTKAGTDTVSNLKTVCVQPFCIASKRTTESYDRMASGVPADMSFVKAASLPIVMVTAHHALVEFARLQKGESILIYFASGGTGEMAIQIAQLIGAEVDASVCSEEKKMLIMDLDHILRITSLHSRHYLCYELY